MSFESLKGKDTKKMWYYSKNGIVPKPSPFLVLLVKSGVHYHILDSLPIALTPSSTIGNTLYFLRCEKVPQASLFLRGSPKKKKTVISWEAAATF